MISLPFFMANDVPAAFSDSVQWDEGDYLERANGAGNDNIATISLWFKAIEADDFQIYTSGAVTHTNSTALAVETGMIISRIRIADSNNNLTTVGIANDFQAWTHLVVAIDTTQAVDVDRHKMWINGQQVTQFSTENYPPQSGNIQWNRTERPLRIGKRQSAESSGALALLHHLDGVVADADDFGELVNGVWVPKAYSGSYGTEGCFLDFSDPADLGADSSGNGNDFTLNGISAANYRADGPTEGVACFNVGYIANNTTLTAANTRAAVSSGAFETVRGNILIPPSGKWYWECTAIGTPDATNVPRCGIVGEDEWSSEQGIQASLHGYCYRWDGVAEHDSVSKGFGDGYTINDVIGVAFDAAAGSLEFYLNGVSQGVAYTGLSGWFYPAVSCGTNFVWQMNFGSIAFAETMPSEYRKLSARNAAFCDSPLPGSACVSVMDTGADVAATLAAARSGWSAYIDIYRNVSSDEDWEVRFSDDGSNSLHFNTTTAKGANASLEAGDPYLAMSIAVSGPTGVYTAEVEHQAGTDTVISHGLMSDTGMFTAIVKRSDDVGDWFVANTKLTVDRIVVLNTDAAQVFATGKVNISGSEITIDRLQNTGTYRVIVIAEKFGVSRLTKYIGNGAAAGPYVFGGVRPEMTIIKRTDGTGDWSMHAWSSLGVNPPDAPSMLNTDAAVPGVSQPLSFQSSGFVVGGTHAGFNANGGEYIAIMFAAAPFGAINGRASNGVF